MLTSTRNPFEIVMIIAGLLAGIAGLLTPVPRDPSERWRVIYGLAAPWAQVFYACLVLGTATVALSLFLQPPMTLLIERVGMMWLAAVFLPYGVGLSIGVLFHFYPASLLIIGYGVACAARALQITYDLQQYQRELQRRISDSPRIAGDSR